MRPKKIVCVLDPDETRLSITKFLLQTNGYAVVSGRMGEPSLKLLAASPSGSIPVVICNSVLPDMTSTYFIRKLREERSDIAVIVLEHDGDRFSDSNLANEYLGKNEIAAERLLSLIKTHCQLKRGPKKHVKVAIPENCGEVVVA